MATKSNTDSNVVEKQKTKKKPEQPPKFHVVLLNDDYTPFDFVIDVLMDVFGKDKASSEALAALIHLDGKGVGGTYIQDFAEMKQSKVMSRAKEEGHPLQCVLEPEKPAPSRSFKP